MVKHNEEARSPKRSHDRGKSHRRREERDPSPARKSSRSDSYHARSDSYERSRKSESRKHDSNLSYTESKRRTEPTIPVKIKKEPVSDDERSSRHSRPRDGPSRDHDQPPREERPSRDHNQPPREERPPRTFKQPRRKSPRSEDAEAANYQYGQQVKDEAEEETPVEKQKPNFGLSGKLTEEKNVFNGIVVKYSEPPEARIPKRRWRFYVFKGEEALPTLYLHRQSAYLIGRDRKVADIPIDHPSCSKQHAAIQFRLVNYDRPDGTAGRTVRPYIIDLEAANGTFVNNQKIEAKRYVELFEKDVVKFGFSSREYVLLHEESKTDASLDDMGVGQ